MFDLHIHTQYSDGEHMPKEVVDIAIQHGLDMMAITDHDTLDGLEEALGHAENRINVLTGIEFSVDRNTSHILGYGFDYKAMMQDGEYKDITEAIKTVKRAKAEEMCKKSKEHPIILYNGKANEISFTMDDLDGLVHGRAVYAGHFGALMVQKVREILGVTIDQYDATRLFFKGDGKIELAERLNVTYGKKNWYVEEDKSVYPSAMQAINLIHKYNGIAVIAHPDEGNTRERVEHYIALGVDGIELYSPKNNGGMSYYQALINKHNLVATGGTDWHGTTYSPDKQMGRLNKNLFRGVRNG